MIRRDPLDTGIAQDFQEDRRGVRLRQTPSASWGMGSAFVFPSSANFGLGSRESASRDLNEQRLRHALSRLIVWPYTNAAAAEYGRIRGTAACGSSHSANRHPDWRILSNASPLRHRLEGFRSPGDFRSDRRKLGVLIVGHGPSQGTIQGTVAPNPAPRRAGNPRPLARGRAAAAPTRCSPR